MAVNTANSAQSTANEAKASAQESAANAQAAANNAAQAVQTAETAQQAAETAQGNAESALTSATTAQTAAENAEAKAIEAANSAYCVRVIDQELSISQTITTADLKPQGNIKVGDTVVGIDGRMFTIASMSEDGTTAVLSSTYVDLTPNVSYSAAQQLTDAEQQTARNNIGFINGVNAWADDNFNQRTDDYLCPILEELILENGGTQQEIDDIKNSENSGEAS